MTTAGAFGSRNAYNVLSLEFTDRGAVASRLYGDEGIMLMPLWSCPSAAPRTHTGSLRQLAAFSAVVTIIAAPESVTRQQSSR